MQNEYDQTNPKSIEDYGKRLVGKTLASQPGIKPIPEKLLHVEIGGRTRGKFGDALERYYFGISPGNDSTPDFNKAGIELKSTPLKYVKDGPAAKERLVLGMIDFVKEAKVRSFEESSFYKKNRQILLVSYEHLAGRPAVQHPVRLVSMLRFNDLPAEDREVIKKDWEKIVAKIRDGRAHELSEGDTDYLGACTKAATGRIRRAQAAGGPPAKPRAYSLKAGYMTVTLRKLLDPVATESEYQPVARRASGFEGQVLERFKPFIGMTAKDIEKELGISLNAKAKGYTADLARRMLGVAGRKIEEFEKAEIQMKAVRRLPSGMPKESVSFSAMRFAELIEEKWDETSKLQDIVEKRFLFVAFDMAGPKTPNKELVFRKAFFWNMPYSDRLSMIETWEKTRKAIWASSADRFPKESQTEVGHVRPHGKNKEDCDTLPDGTLTTKRAFWLNKKYLKKVLS